MDWGPLCIALPQFQLEIIQQCMLFTIVKRVFIGTYSIVFYLCLSRLEPWRVESIKVPQHCFQLCFFLNENKVLKESAHKFIITCSLAQSEPCHISCILIIGSCRRLCSGQNSGPGALQCCVVFVCACMRTHMHACALNIST